MEIDQSRLTERQKKVYGRIVEIPELEGQYCLLSHEVYTIHRKRNITKETKHIDIFGPGWVFFKALSKGTCFAVIRDGERINLGTQIMGYAPGNSVIEWALPIGYIEYELLVCEIPIDKNAPNNPICSNLTSFNMNIFDCFETFFMNWQELNTMQIQRTTEPTKLALDIQEWIHKNWQKNFKLQDLAKELGICPSLISRYFKKTFGMSPLKYTNQMRIVSSVRDLLKSQRPISQISFDLGFGDTRQFNEHFRKIYPVKPFAFKLPKR